jgi:hypothetical protein
MNKKLQISKIVSIKLIEWTLISIKALVLLRKYHLAIKKCDLHYPLFHPIIGMIGHGQSNHW